MDSVPIVKGLDSYSLRGLATPDASLWCGLFVIALGISVLIGWTFEIEFLKTLFVGYASMKPNTALAFVLLGTSLSRRSMAARQAKPSQPETDSIATWGAALVILIAAMTVIEYVASVDLGIDQLLFRQPGTIPYPGRMASATALALLCLGLSLVTPRTVNGELIDGRTLSSFIALSISVVAFIGYLIDAPSLYQLSAYVSMALHTSIGLIVLSCGTLLYLNNRQSVGVSELEIFTPQTSTARPALRPTIFAAFGFLAISAAGSILLFLSVIKAQGWVTHTFMVHQTADSLLGELRDSETAQRGFIVTGNPSYLEPYDKSLTNIPGIQSKLRELTEDNAEQQARLMDIRSQVANKLNELSQSIELERSGHHADALGLVTSNADKGFMDAIRGELVTFLADENALLDKRQGWLQKMQTAGITAAVLCLLLTVASGRSVANMLYAYFAGLQDARQKLTEANASLDRRVAEQTAELAETEQQRRFALEVAELGDWTLDLATDQSVRSTRHDLIFGYKTPPDTWGFAQFIEHVMPEDRDFVTSAFESALAKKDDWRFECRIRRHGEGEIRWIDVQGKHYNSQITGKKGLLGTVADITDRKLAEVSLATTNRRLALLGRVSNDLIVGASPRELLKSAFDAVAEEVRAEYYFNYLVDTTQPGWLELTAAGGLDDDQKRDFGHIAFGQHLCGRVAQTREALVLDNIDLSTDSAASGVRAMGIRSYVGLPLSAHGKLFGTLAFGSIAPRFDAADIELIKLITDQFAATLDRTQLVKAIAESDERQRLAISAAAFATFDADLTSGRANWSKEHFAMLGYEPVESGAASIDMWRDRIHPEDLKTVMAELERSKSKMDTFSAEHRIVRADDGTVRWLAKTGQPHPDSFGQARRLVGVVRDITARKDAEEHQRFLMLELAHRSKNLLAIVVSLAGQTARTVTTLDDFSDRFRKRLQGLSASQEVLLHQDWRGAPVSELVRNQLAAFAPEAAGRIVLSGPNVIVGTAAAEALGLALHELATNAVKYGALSVSAGKIHVTWTVDAPQVDPRMFHMSWVESGGPPVAPPTRTGFGNIVIERMVAASLDGTVTLTYPETGVFWNLSAPVTSCIQNI